MELQVGKVCKEVRESQTIFAAAGDIQAKPTRVSGGLDILVITGQAIVGPSDHVLRLVFFSGAVRGLLLDRSPQAIYRIVRTCCG